MWEDKAIILLIIITTINTVLWVGDIVKIKPTLPNTKLDQEKGVIIQSQDDASILDIIKNIIFSFFKTAYNFITGLLFKYILILKEIGVPTEIITIISAPISIIQFMGLLAIARSIGWIR